MKTASAIPIPRKPLIKNLMYSVLVKFSFQNGMFKKNKSNKKHINAIVFFRALIKNGDILWLRDLKITTAILQKIAAKREKISPGTII